MKFRDVAASIVMVALGCAILSIRASAQNSPPSLMSASSSGLTADVVGVAYNASQNQLSAQIIIKNTNNVRVYVEDTTVDSTQTAFLGSGQSAGQPTVNGLPSCDNTYAMCSNSNSSNTAIDNFSYIDPGNVLAVALQYNISQPPSNPDTISFSLTMMARFAKSDVDNSPDDVGPVREITLAFPFLSFSQKS
jgi:hypothetical protein